MQNIHVVSKSLKQACNEKPVIQPVNNSASQFSAQKEKHVKIKQATESVIC